MTETVTHPNRHRTLPAVAGAVVAVLLVAALAVWLSTGGDAAPAASTDSPSATSTTTDPAPDSPTSTDVPDVPDVPAVDPAAAAGEASAAGVPALVPDALADRSGVVSAASFDEAAGLWQLEVTTASGTVVVRQHVGSAADLLGEYAADATEGDPVDLARWGLGTWSTWATSEAAMISRDLPGGGALISGPDLATVTTVTKTLLTYEDNRGGEQD